MRVEIRVSIRLAALGRGRGGVCYHGYHIVCWFSQSLEGVLDYTGGLRSCLLVVLCAFLDTVAVVYLRATPQDGATLLLLTTPATASAAIVTCLLLHRISRSTT